MGLVSNRFTITAIHDGQNANAIMRSTTTLSQRINKQTGACAPNWQTSHPQVWVETDLGGEKKAPAIFTWKYNSVPLTFSDDNLCTTEGYEGKFQKTTRTVGGIVFPAVNIMDNLATVSNTDNDIIEMTGSIELSGAQLDFSIALPVRISELSESGYWGQLEGDTMVTSQQTKATILGKLYVGASQVSDQFWTRWYNEGTGSQIGSTIASASISGEQAAKFEITDAGIDDNIVLRCDFYTENPATVQNATVQASAFWEVDDETDDEKMYVSTVTTNNASTLNKGGIFLRKGQSVIITGWMGKTTSPSTIDTRYTHFYCRLFDHKNQVITATGSPMGGQAPVEDGTNKGLFEVTTDVSVPDVTGTVKGGRLEVDFDYLTTTLGDDGSGVMIAATYDVINDN